MQGDTELECEACGEFELDPNSIFCPSCGMLVVDIEELDLSPNADIDKLFKQVPDYGKN